MTFECKTRFQIDIVASRDAFSLTELHKADDWGINVFFENGNGLNSSAID